MKKFTTQDFIKKSKSIHGDLYDYSDAIYVDSSTKIKITCKVHGEFEQLPQNHYKYGCGKCGKQNIWNTRGRTTVEDFIKRARLKHGDKYDYSKSVYENKDKKLIIICPIHGEFEQTPANHYKHGCKSCGHIMTNSKKTIPVEEFLKECKEAHGDKYNYEYVNYVNRRTKVIIECPIHGLHEAAPYSHIKSGCPKCGRMESNLAKTSNTEEFIKKAELIHGDKYDYSKVNYKTAVSKITIVCKKHGEFTQSPNKHLSGRGCPFCKNSKGESLINLILKKYNIEYQSEVTFKTDVLNFRVDFLIENKIIEFNGMQHYKPVDYFGGEEKFKKQVIRDKFVRQYAKDNNYELLEIPYTYDDFEIEQSIINFLKLAPNTSNSISKSGNIGELCDGNTEINTY